MLKKINKILKLINSSNFLYSVPKKRIVFFDCEGFKKYKNSYNFLLKHNDYFILKTRLLNIDKIYLNINIIFNLIIYYLKIKNFKAAYLVSLLLEINPKIVITNIDNSIDFSLAAKQLHKKIKFLAVQNAARYEFDEPFYDKNQNKKYFIPELACFGEYEKSLYKKHKIDVKNFFVIGSLTLTEYLNQKKKKFENNKYDLCLILEESTGWNNYYPGFEEAMGKIAFFTTKFANEKNLKLVIAGKRKEKNMIDQEKKFYSRFINFNYEVTPKFNFSSYYAMENSNLTIGMMSTILREGLALNKKILSCNFTGCQAWDFPIKGICFFEENDYNSFSERLTKLLNLDFNNYKKFLDYPPSYIMSLDKKNLADQILKNKINSIIK